MRIMVLHVPGCPNADALMARVTLLVAGRAPVERQAVRDFRDAAALGMRGSPTLLIDGIDPFALADQPPSLSCRLYRDETGAPVGAPSLDQLRDALDARGISHD
jgi:hypothetical protein